MKIPPEIINDILTDNKRGLGERKLAEKFKYSRSTIRKILGRYRLSPASKIKKEQQIEAKEIKSKSLVKHLESIKEITPNVEVLEVNTIINKNRIEVFDAVKQACEDMLNLNMEQRNGLDETIKNVNEIAEYIKLKSSPFDPIREAIWNVISQINSIYTRGKLRVMSQDQLGKWVDRYENLKGVELQFNYYENLINSLFEGINTLTADQYMKLRSEAIRFFSETEKLFISNENQK